MTAEPDAVLKDNTIADLKLKRTMPYRSPLPERRRLRAATSALSIAAALAASMPPRNSGRVVVPPVEKTPERLAAAQSKRERKAASRARNAQ